MAAWHSLAGYLVLRPAGALSRLKSRKRQWYVFDESRCKLLYYKNEADSRVKQPLGDINIRGAAISLTLEENNQFIIHSDGKEYVLAADTHESMMLWVLALQAKRDAFCNSTKPDTDSSDLEWRKPEEIHKNVSFPPNNEVETRIRKAQNEEDKTKIFRTQSLQLRKPKNNEPVRHNALSRMRSLWMGQSMDSDFSGRDGVSHPRKLSPVAQSVDLPDDEEETSLPSSRGGSVSSDLSRPSRSATSSESSQAAVTTPTFSSPPPLPPVSPPAANTDDNNNNSSNGGCGGGRRSTRHSPPSSSSTDTESGCDSDTFDPEDGVAADDGSQPSTRYKARLLRQMNSDTVRPEDTGNKERKSWLSGTSVSSESTSECSHSSRLQELESDMMTTKCELAKALNRESAYKTVIDDKEAMIVELEERLTQVEEGVEDFWKHSPVKGSAANKRLLEKCRILQNHNRFLNEEVLKLSRMLQQEQCRNQNKQHRIMEVEGENDQFKRDYVFLLQSSLRITGNDGPEAMEVYLYGGARHKARVLRLLEEARRINPTLPTYESLTKSMCHIDPLGFKHSYTDEGLILHYICRQLHLHYSTLVPGYERHQQQWKKYLRQHSSLQRTKELKALVRRGIPTHLRRRVWCALYRTRVRDIMEDKGSHYYNFLCSLAPDSESVNQHKRQIALDLLRTMPENIRFCDHNADGVKKMQEVLQAFCLHNSGLGYCQGMNFLVGMCLLFMEPEDAFWCLVAITERYFTPNYFDQNLIGAQADQEVLKDLLKDKMPAFYNHLLNLDIELCTVTLNWFLAIFFDCVPLETLLRIWDCFLLEGPKVLFRFSLAILRLNSGAILSKHDTVSIMRQLKASAKLCFDVESLIKAAFEGLKPFPRRQDIAAKQACYYKTLKEQSKKMELEKKAFKDREKMLSEMEIYGANQLVIECASVYDGDKLWLCHGHQNGAQITKVNCEESIMYRLNIELESQVMCMHTLDDDTMVLGTLSHFVHAYSTRSRRLIWETRLNDSVLSLCFHEEDGNGQIYAGLADGTIAVIENFNGSVPKPESFYILIDSSPVTCLLLVDRRLWCACGNRVVILSARTLDTVDQFQTSSSSLDYISMLVPGEQGVWVAIRGSSVLQLWDLQLLTCRLLFDVRDNRYPRSPRREDDNFVSQGRITAVLPFDGSVLVGTAEGFLIIYDITTRLSRSASAVDSPFMRRSAPVNVSNVDQIQERIQELLLERQRREQEESQSYQEATDERNRSDSGCYTTPTPTSLTALSRRESSQVPDFLDTKRDNESPEDKSEDTSGSTVRRFGTSRQQSTDTITSPTLPQTWEDGETAEELTPEPNPNKTLSSPSSYQADSSPPASCYLSSTSLSFSHNCLTSPPVGDTFSTSQNQDSETSNDFSVNDRHLQNSDSKHIPSFSSEFSYRPSKTVFTNSSDSSTLDSKKEQHTCAIHRSDLETCSCRTYNSKTQEIISRLLARNTESSQQSKVNGSHGNEPESSASSSRGSVFQNEEGSPEKMKERFISLLELRSKSPRRARFTRTVSADNISRWHSRETLSSFTSDSYDFDDLFVAYTEDESCRKKSDSFASYTKETEEILKSLRNARRRVSYSVVADSSDFRRDSWLPLCRKSAYTLTKTDSTSMDGTNPTDSHHLHHHYQFQSWHRDSLVKDASGITITVKPTESTLPPNLISSQPYECSSTKWFSCEDDNSSVTESEPTKKPLNQDLLQLGDWSSNAQKGSETASNVSFCSTEVPYTYELSLQEKIKISDKPIKCLLETRCNGEPAIISCAGCYGDDEAVLKWTREGDDKLWTNDPIIEVCPYTNAIKPSPYARSRLPLRTSPMASSATSATESDCTAKGSRSSIASSASSASSVVGSGLAKVQNIFLRVHDKS